MQALAPEHFTRKVLITLGDPAQALIPLRLEELFSWLRFLCTSFWATILVNRKGVLTDAGHRTHPPVPTAGLKVQRNQEKKRNERSGIIGHQLYFFG